MGGSDRGESRSIGPFEFRTPDRDCQVVDCENKADGVVDMENGSINTCTDCAPQYLQHNDNEWTPLAGGRSLETDGRGGG